MNGSLNYWFTPFKKAVKFKMKQHSCALPRDNFCFVWKFSWGKLRKKSQNYTVTTLLVTMLSIHDRNVFIKEKEN